MWSMTNEPGNRTDCARVVTLTNIILQRSQAAAEIGGSLCVPDLTRMQVRKAVMEAISAKPLWRGPVGA